MSYRLPTGVLADYLHDNGLDCTRDSRQLMRDLGAVFRTSIPISVLVLAALFAGYAVIPQASGTLFKFCRVETT